MQDEACSYAPHHGQSGARPLRLHQPLREENCSLGRCPPPPAEVASASLSALSATENNCLSAILEPERSPLLQEALSDSKLQAVQAQLERRGVTMKATEAMALKLPNGEQLLIPFGDHAHLVWTRTNGQTSVLGLVRQGNQTLNLSADGSERRVRMLEGAKVQRLLGKLREKTKFQEFEQKLREKGKRVAENKLRVLLDETNHLALIGLPNEGSEEILHQLRIRLKVNRDEELEENAEPQIQATACGKATGEALASAATLQPQFEGGEGGSWGGYEGPQICTSQWGYSYSCTSTTPVLNLSSTSVQVATFAGQAMTASVTIWNSGGGTLTGSATTAVPFSIVSGGSFSLGPGQPQTVTVRFSSTTTGGFSGNLQLSSNGGSKTVALMGGTISVSPAQLSYTAFVGSPQEQKITLKNDGAVAATVNLGQLSAPFGFRNANSAYFSSAIALAGGQTHEVWVKFDPTASGNFSGSTALSLSGTCVRWSEEVLDGRSRCLEQSVAQGSVNAALAGLAHKVSVAPSHVDFGIAIVDFFRTQRIAVKNESSGSLAFVADVSAPYQLVSDNSLVSQISFSLVPGETRHLAIKLRPTITGAINGSLRLSIGTLSVELPVSAVAYTLQDYIRLIKEAGGYNISFSERTTSQNVLMLAGLSGLTPAKINSFWDMFGSPPEENQDVDPQRIEDVLRAIEILESIDPEQTRVWLETLSQAYNENRLQEEYEHLLSTSQGFRQYTQALWLMTGGSGQPGLDDLLQFFEGIADLQEFLRQQLTENPYKDPVIGAMQWAVKKALDFRVGGLANIYTGRLAELYGSWDMFIALIPSGLLSNPQEKYAVSTAIMMIAINMIQNIRLLGLGVTDCTSNLGQCLGSLSQFLQWATSMSDPTLTLRDRMNQAIGTLYTFSWFASVSWHMHGFVFDGNQAIGVMYLPRALSDGRGIVALVRGDHCSSCGSEANFRNIRDWIGTALSKLQPLLCPSGSCETDPWAHAYNPSENERIILLAFTNPNATGVDELIRRLQQELAGHPLLRTGIYVIRFKDGQWKAECIAGACNQEVLGKLQDALRRALANSADPDFDLWSIWVACGGDADCVLWQLEQLAG